MGKSTNSKEAKKIIPGNASVSIYDIMERCALNEEDEIKLFRLLRFLRNSLSEKLYDR